MSNDANQPLGYQQIDTLCDTLYEWGWTRNPDGRFHHKDGASVRINYRTKDWRIVVVPFRNAKAADTTVWNFLPEIHDVLPGTLFNQLARLSGSNQ